MNNLDNIDLQVGDIYQDCSYHPVICVSLNREDDEVTGISLIDGSSPRSCSLLHCGIRKITIEEAWNIKINGPSDSEVKQEISKEKQWWLLE